MKTKPQSQPNKLNSPEIEKTLVVSTAHMTDHDDIILARAALQLWDKCTIGYRIPVCTDKEEIEEQDLDFVKLGFSSAFLRLLTLTRKCGCTWLKLDPDGPIYEGITEFTW